MRGGSAHGPITPWALPPRNRGNQSAGATNLSIDSGAAITLPGRAPLPIVEPATESPIQQRQSTLQQTPGSRSHDPKGFYHSGATPIFASQSDQRFHYCLYVPTTPLAPDRVMPLVVIMHGTGRTGPQYRDAFADFAEEHGCTVCAPIFPAGIDDPGELHNYKFIEYHGIRFDQVLLDIVDEVGRGFPVETSRFFLHGFSGGGQFSHRFFYLHPERLAGVSIGAPGRITQLDPGLSWWLGTGGFGERFGRDIDLAELRKVPVHMVVGELDTETWEINNPGDTNWMDGVQHTGRTRIERLRTLRAGYERHGIDVRFDLVPGVAHNGFGVLDTVRSFVGDHLDRR